MFKRFIAFTLAEVLIVLMIIGIVAELTIPTLVQNIQDQQTVSMLKKEYSVLSQAYILAVNDNGTPDNWGLNGSDDPQGALNILNIFKPYLKISQNCGLNSGCFYSGYYRYLNNTNEGVYDSGNFVSKIILLDGVSVLFMVRDANCAQARGTSLALSNICANIQLDINGTRPPNQWGVDYFNFYLTKYGIIPAGTSSESDNYNSFVTACKDTTKSGLGCTAWVIYNENKDYQKCSNLSWDGPTKCQ